MHNFLEYFDRPCYFSVSKNYFFDWSNEWLTSQISQLTGKLLVKLNQPIPRPSKALFKRKKVRPYLQLFTQFHRSTNYDPLSCVAPLATKKKKGRKEWSALPGEPTKSASKVWGRIGSTQIDIQSVRPHYRPPRRPPAIYWQRYVSFRREDGGTEGDRTGEGSGGSGKVEKSKEDKLGGRCF